ncbi:ThiF family adenylyltransferase [Isoptericola sp. S6320L]|uniref:ThiF family adenylyltransferase n=1 Tax=Isoptericola sp. S6320L TaxID=2926411 RepID=UPI001FF5ABD0|nr:ThiF family adenylyltransferase [Isoptericola sp. S6320L]MCK0117396.1 ThiF family adenylyltransferase [Isoptericola sp. S6320L]
MASSSTSPEPAALRLRPGAPVLGRGPGEVQLGTDSRWSLVLSGLADAETRWLTASATTQHASLERTAARHRVEDERRREIGTLLADCGFLVPSPRRTPDVLATAGGAADAPVLGALLPDGGGMVTLARRAVRRVGVSGLGRIGAMLAAHLATAGVGTLVLDDDSPVQVTDLGTGTYRQTDVGHRRAARLEAALGARYPRTAWARTWHADALPDVVVAVCDRVVRPETFTLLMSAGIPHLPVVVGEADVTLGPFVLPGSTACTACWHRHATDADERWPELVDQLAELPAAPGQETVLSVTAAALAAGQVLAHLDGTRPAAAGAVLEVTLPEAVARTRPVEAHPACPCTVPPR